MWDWNLKGVFGVLLLQLSLYCDFGIENQKSSFIGGSAGISVLHSMRGFYGKFFPGGERRLLMFTIAGTVKNSVKMAALDSQWQQKKNQINRGRTSEMTAQERQLQRLREQAEEIRESREAAGIRAKLMSGSKLTAEEIEYLRRNNPEALKEYEEAQMERESYKRKLQNCKSKEEVERLKTTKMGEFLSAVKKISNNPNIPKSAKIGLLQKLLQRVAGVESEHQKFIQSAQYAMLPEEDEEKKDKKDRGHEDVPEAESEAAKGEMNLTGTESMREIMENLRKLAGEAVPSGSVIDVAVAENAAADRAADASADAAENAAPDRVADVSADAAEAAVSDRAADGIRPVRAAVKAAGTAGGSFDITI